MLSKKTKALMKAIYNRAIEKDGVCIVSPLNLLQDVSFKISFDREDLDPALKLLATEGYFEIIETEKKGITYYCITLLQPGYDFSRQIAVEKRAIKFKIILTVAGVIASFILTRIISAIWQ